MRPGCRLRLLGGAGLSPAADRRPRGLHGSEWRGRRERCRAGRLVAEVQRSDSVEPDRASAGAESRCRSGGGTDPGSARAGTGRRRRRLAAAGRGRLRDPAADQRERHPHPARIRRRRFGRRLRSCRQRIHYFPAWLRCQLGTRPVRPQPARARSGGGPDRRRNLEPARHANVGRGRRRPRLFPAPIGPGTLP